MNPYAPTHPTRPRPSRPVARHSSLGLALAASLLLSACASVAPPQGQNAAGSTSGAAGQTTSSSNAARPNNRAKSASPYGTALSEIATASSTLPAVVTLSAPSDLWDRIRRGLTMPNLDNELVRDREQWYASRPDYILRMTERSSRYLFHIVEEIERRNMPMELALLPFIESAFNPQAVSSARAAGMWQFMPATGESFDLKQNIFRDDRRDVLASTRAALDYLQQLHNRFGDWHLALAAYNWGQGNVNRAITRNQQAGLPSGYTDLNMPMETRMYVPKLQAVKNIIANPQAFRAQLPVIGNHPFFETVTLDRDMDVAVIARLADISESDFRALNPSHKHPVVLAAGRPTILLPWDNAAIFERNLQTHAGPLATWTAWVVPGTMSAAQAAERVGMAESELRSVNNIPPRMMVQAGSSLLVPRQGRHDNDVSVQVAENGFLNLQPEVVLKRRTVQARKGDSLLKLADRYDLSPARIAEWNKLSVNAKLQKGQIITLLLPERHPAMANAERDKDRRESARESQEDREVTRADGPLKTSTARGKDRGKDRDKDGEKDREKGRGKDREKDRDQDREKDRAKAKSETRSAAAQKNKGKDKDKDTQLASARGSKKP